MDNTFSQSTYFSLPFRLSGSVLKVVAVIAMTLDHVAYFLMSPESPFYDMMRCIGRIAFPVFALLIAEGFAHSSNRLRYFITLFAFGILSELPWFLLNGNDGSHNVMFTLAIGVLALCLFDRLCEHKILALFAVSFLCFLSYWIGVDYDWKGIAVIVIFYILRHRTIWPWLQNTRINFFSQALLQVTFIFPLIYFYGLTGAIIASALILFYDGSRGFIRGKICKYAFYAFYPIHLYLLYLLLQ